MYGVQRLPPAGGVTLRSTVVAGGESWSLFFLEIAGETGEKEREFIGRHVEKRLVFFSRRKKGKKRMLIVRRFCFTCDCHHHHHKGSPSSAVAANLNGREGGRRRGGGSRGCWMGG